MTAEKEKLDDKLDIPEDYYVTSEDVNFLPPKYESIFTISDKVSQNSMKKRKDLASKKCQCIVSLLLLAVLIFIVIIGVIGLKFHFSHRLLNHRMKNGGDKNTIGLYRGNCPVFFPENPEIHNYNEKIEINEKYSMVESQKFQEFSGASVLHLFDLRKTIIKTENKCLIKPMRSDLHRPVDFEDLITKLMNGDYIPNAHLIREHWYLVQPAIPQPMLFFRYGYRVAELCAGIPTYHLVSRSSYESHHFARQPNVERCSQLSCVIDKPCPEGMLRELDEKGCIVSCNCISLSNVDTNIRKIVDNLLCPILSNNNCPLQCPLGYKQHEPNGCDICECRAPLRQIRSVEENCDITDRVFEGVEVGDTRALASVDFVHYCK